MRINDSGVSFCIITNIVHIVIKVITAGSRCLFAPEQVIGLVSKTLNLIQQKHAFTNINVENNTK